MTFEDPVARQCLTCREREAERRARPIDMAIQAQARPCVYGEKRRSGKRSKCLTRPHSDLPARFTVSVRQDVSATFRFRGHIPARDCRVPASDARSSFRVTSVAPKTRSCMILRLSGR